MDKHYASRLVASVPILHGLMHVTIIVVQAKFYLLLVYLSRLSSAWLNSQAPWAEFYWAKARLVL